MDPVRKPQIQGVLGRVRPRHELVVSNEMTRIACSIQDADLY